MDNCIKLQLDEEEEEVAAERKEVLDEEKEETYLVRHTEEISPLEKKISTSHHLLSLSWLKSRRCYLLRERLHVNFISDEWYRFQISGTGSSICLFDSIEAFRLVKFAFITILSILIFHLFVRWMGGDWEFDENYQISHLFLYDFNSIVLDIIIFFIVGRVYQREGFDRLLPCIIPMLIGILYPSWSEANLWFLRHSFSTYEIMCNWPWQLFVYCIFVGVLSVSLIVWHVKRLIIEKRIISHLLEILISCTVFILPIMTHPNFHLHHWYIARIVGMHLNPSDGISQAAQAFFWGQYMNGVAVWGRDPVLTCAYAYYISTDINCAYMNCFLDHDNSTNDDGHYKTFVTPDWHNCSASYVP